MLRHSRRRMAATLLFAAFATGGWSALPGSPDGSDAHCAPGAHAGVVPTQHMTHGALDHRAPAQSTVSARDAHECTHCPAHHCAAVNHCAAPATAALPMAAPPLDLSPSLARPTPWVGGPPLSSNPAPPIPPPQPVL